MSAFFDDTRVTNINSVWEDVSAAADMAIAEAKASCDYEQRERLLAVADRLNQAMRGLTDMLTFEADEFKKEALRLFETK